MSYIDELEEIFSNPQTMKLLTENIILINKLFRELEKARISLCFSIVLNEDETRIYSRAVRYTSILNRIKELYGKRKVDVKNILDDMYIKCKEIYDIVYIDGKMRMLPKRSKVYINVKRKLERLGDDYGD